MLLLRLRIFLVSQNFSCHEEVSMKGVLGKILRWMSRELSPVLHNLLKPFSSPPGKMYVYGVISPIIVLFLVEWVIILRCTQTFECVSSVYKQARIEVKYLSIQNVSKLGWVLLI